MHRYCTYFDQRFLDRGLAMIRSLRRVDPDCRITVLCLTASCEQALRVHEPGLTLIRLADFERANPDLLALKPSRGPRDYPFAFSSCLVVSELEGAPDDEIVTYLDADLRFYASPQPVFAAMAGASVGLIGHRHHWWARRLEKYGRFNVGWVSFRSDAAGRQAAGWWRERCIEWCFGRFEGGRFADQKYLDHIYAKFPNVVEVTHPGANAGPWNVCRHAIARAPDGSLIVDRSWPLIFFHFSQLKETRPNIYLCSNVSYLGPFSRAVRNEVYRPYIAELTRIREELGGLPQEDSPDLRGSPPALRARLALVLSIAALLMGHYVQFAKNAYWWIEALVAGF